MAFIPKSLIKNKKRTLFISISIVLSAMLITTLSITISNYKKQTIEDAKIQSGEKEFVLGGILQNRMDSMRERKTKGYLTINSVKNTLSEDAYRYNHHFTLKSFYNVEETLKNMSTIQGVFINQNYSYIDALKSAKTMNYIFLVLNIIILIAAISVIYNIYSISVVERMHEFGLLRAIGADSKQIQMILFGEGIILGFIFIPSGILFGVLSVNEISRLFYSSNNLGIPSIISNKSELPLWGIILSLVVCSISIFISIYFPAKKASEISPMEAISTTSVQGEQLERSKSNKKARISRKFTTSMAYTNLTRNKKRFITTVISFSISIILFIAVV